jgi:hypothetical protein
MRRSGMSHSHGERGPEFRAAARRAGLGTALSFSRSKVVGIKRERATGPIFCERLVRETVEHVQTRCDGSIECQVPKNCSGEILLFVLG